MTSDPTLAAVAAAYEGVEASFADAAEVERYRATMLERTAEQADLIAGLLEPGATAVEIGCGNGRLLIELARRGVLSAAGGIDVASSRIEFARRWAADEGHGGLEFAAADALTAGLGEGRGAAICITGALGYFGAAHSPRDGELIARLRETLAPSGLLVLELYPHPRERALLEAAGGEARLWRELPDDDPWRFYLSHLTLRDGVLHHAKTFIHRHDGTVDEGRSEALYLYTPEELRGLLDGFDDVELREGWSDAPYAGGDVLVVTARRATSA